MSQVNPAYESDKLYIGGSWVAPHGVGYIEVRSPATQEVIGHVPDADTDDIDAAVQAARKAFDESDWPHLSFGERAAYLRRAAKVLSSNVELIARVTSAESGIPISQAMVLAERPAGMVKYYAALGEAMQDEDVRRGEATSVTVRREPVGVAGIITPWNSPIPLAHFSLPAALLAGCSVVLKTAAETPLHGQVLGELYESVGLPAGVINILAANREVSARLAEHPEIDKISFTGSSATGKTIASVCGSQLKRYTLELGGKSAAIILDDADIAQTLPALVPAAVQNNGEACIGQTRILAPASRYDEVVEALAAALGSLPVGDPNSPETVIGPLISEQHRARVENYIRVGIDEGAQLVLGGGRPEGLEAGYYVQPTLFRDVTNSMRIAREEIFGPVYVVIPYTDDDDAVRIANNTHYGLSGTVWTSDRERAMRIARRVRTGNYGVNTFYLENGSPFGGYKNSGVGRQLGPEGLDAFLEYKSIHEPLS